MLKQYLLSMLALR